MPGAGKFNPKEDRQIQHIIESEKSSGKSPKDAENIAYGTVQKQKKKKKRGK